METNKAYTDELKAANALHKKADLIIELLYEFKRPKPVAPAFYTVKDTATRIGRSTRTVRRYVKDNILKPVRIGRRVMFNAAEVDDLVQAIRQRG